MVQSVIYQLHHNSQSHRLTHHLEWFSFPFSPYFFSLSHFFIWWIFLFCSSFTWLFPHYVFFFSHSNNSLPVYQNTPTIMEMWKPHPQFRIVSKWQYFTIGFHMIFMLNACRIERFCFHFVRNLFFTTNGISEKDLIFVLYREHRFWITEIIDWMPNTL